MLLDTGDAEAICMGAADPGEGRFLFMLADVVIYVLGNARILSPGWFPFLLLFFYFFSLWVLSHKEREQNGIFVNKYASRSRGGTISLGEECGEAGGEEKVVGGGGCCGRAETL